MAVEEHEPPRHWADAIRTEQQKMAKKQQVIK